MTPVKARTVSDEARKVLSLCTVDDDAISLPPVQLDRPLYEEVNAIFSALGGKWNRSRKAHVFSDPTGTELAEQFYAVVETGTWERPQDAGYFPTPDWLVDRMIGMAAIQPYHRVLEPSAGQGAILAKIARKLDSRHQLALCEILPANQKVLCEQGFELDAADFMTLECGELFDRVLMNPPFGKSQAPLHVRHAIELLKPGGRLVAIMPSSIMQRQDRLHREVRAELIRNGKILPVEEGAFKDSGTLVRTVMVVYDKPTAASSQSVCRQPAAMPPQMPARAPERPVAASVPVEPPPAPTRRFRRLSDGPRRFRRLARPR
jgi:protein-L-isoaspartate O-methyltransferase